MRNGVRVVRSIVSVVVAGVLLTSCGIFFGPQASAEQAVGTVEAFIDAVAACAGPDGCADVDLSQLAAGDALTRAQHLRDTWADHPIAVNVDRSFEVVSSYSEDGKATAEVCVSWSFNRAWADDRESISSADGEPSGQLWIDDFALDYVDGRCKVAAIGYKRSCRPESATTTDS